MLNAVFGELDQEVALIKYPVNFPGTGDRYYTEEVGARRTYYTVNGAPTMVLGGETVTLNSTLFSEEAFRTYMRDKMAAAGKTPFNIVFETLTMNCEAKSLTVAFRVETKGNLADAKLYTVVLERETSGNKGSNGETSFHHVMMKMEPSRMGGKSVGLSIDLKADTVYRFNYAIDMGATHMEECDDLMVVCFIQGADKAVAQSAIERVGMLANERIGLNTALSIYPNPASESVTLPGLDNATVELFDLAGRLHFAADGVSGDYALDVRDRKPGMYVLKVREAGQVSAARLNIVR